MSRFVVSGCQDKWVAEKIHGNYTKKGEHHGKAYYQKDGSDVVLYFWDERDGPKMGGWFFGEELGGDLVFSRNATKVTYVSQRPKYNVFQVSNENHGFHQISMKMLNSIKFSRNLSEIKI